MNSLLPYFFTSKFKHLKIILSDQVTVLESGRTLNDSRKLLTQLKRVLNEIDKDEKFFTIPGKLNHDKNCSHKELDNHAATAGHVDDEQSTAFDIDVMNQDELAKNVS